MNERRENAEITGISTLVPWLIFRKFAIQLLIMPRQYDLEVRVIEFSVSVIKLAQAFPKSLAGNYLAGQLTRSATSPSLQYGEAQSAESRSDFIHKMKIALKELRETSCCLQIVSRLDWFENDMFTNAIKECDELISIFVKSISTAQKNLR